MFICEFFSSYNFKECWSDWDAQISFYNNPGSAYCSRVVDEHLSEQLQMPVPVSAKNHKTMQTFDIIFSEREGENEPCHLYFPLNLWSML